MKTTATGYNLSIDINNITLSYDDLGYGTTPIIFLHGFPFNKTMWKNQLEFLQSSHRVIALDLRGFGASADEITPLSIDLFTDDLMQFMRKLHIDKAIICGLSMGGYIALNAVKRYPDCFAALILCDTQCIADTPEAKEKRYKAIHDITANGIEEFSEKFIKSVFHEHSFNSKKDVVEKLRNIVFSTSPHSMISGLTALAERMETCSILHKITMPTLIICGREDKVTPVGQSESMHTRIEGAVMRIIEDAGHVSNLENPEDFNKHIQYFLNALNTIDVLTGNHKGNR